MSDDLINSLNYDFNVQVYLFYNAVDNLSTHDKTVALAWVNKLKTAAGSVEEAQVRNDFIYYLLKSCNAGQLKPPFREKPPKSPLLNLMNLLPPEAGTKDPRGVRKRAEIFEKSPDKGAFLAAQPVPRYGAFCYLAGLQYLHTFPKKPLIHGEVKSAKIYFGLAREGPNALNSTMQVSRVYDTKPYLPMEFLRLKSLSTEVDTYSVGVVLLGLVTGQRAYDQNRKHKFLPEHILALSGENVPIDTLMDKLLLNSDENAFEICHNIIVIGE